jgi:hypothetical protein
MSHESRPSAIRAWYQTGTPGYSRLSFSTTLHSAISLPHVCHHSVHRGFLVGEGTSGDTSLPLGRCSAIDTYSASVAAASSELSDGGLEGVSVLEVAIVFWRGVLFVISGKGEWEGGRFWRRRDFRDEGDAVAGR